MYELVGENTTAVNFSYTARLTTGKLRGSYINSYPSNGGFKRAGGP